MKSRAELLKTHGFDVTSVIGNDAAKAALRTPKDYSLFMIGTAAPSQARHYMATWLKSKYPNVPVLALNPPYKGELEPADYNVILNGPEEWLFVVETATT